MTLNELQTAVAQFKQALTAATDALTDETALTAKQLYPTYDRCVAERRTVTQGFRFRYGDKLYKTLQPSTTFDGTFAPSISTAALYAEVALPADGTLQRPIQYNGNMALEEGKYYSQGGVTYICTRDTGVPVYNALVDLVGIYVDIVE